MLYTVMGRYKENDQPYSTVVEAGNEAEAVEAVQADCARSNGWDDGSWGEEYSVPLIVEDVLVGDVLSGQPPAGDAGEGTYTVVARYEDNDQPYSEVVRASGDEDAIAKVQAICREGLGWDEKDGDPLVIEDVLFGDVYAGQPASDGTWERPTAWEGK